MQKVRRHSYLSRISTAYRVTNSRSISPVHRLNFKYLKISFFNSNLVFEVYSILLAFQIFPLQYFSLLLNL